MSRPIEQVKGFLAAEIKEKSTLDRIAEEVLRGAEEGGEIQGDYKDFDEWFEKRFKYQLVWLDKDDYLRALVRALWLAPNFAGTDFGSSRQRDMAQVWTDTARGFLGEIAVAKFLLEKFSIESASDIRRGNLADFLPTDIHRIKVPDGEWREPHLNISIKTTKFNGRWLDVPGAQIDHSDIFILVKIGVSRNHFLAFLKAISFLRDKLFPQAVALGELDEEKKEALWKEIPPFDPIPAYIAGFLDKHKLNLPIHEVACTKKGRKNVRISITHGVGIFSRETLREHEEIKKLDPAGSLEIEIVPIIDALTTPHFLAHSGGLKWGQKEWEDLVKNL
ncbi:hypothetical protein O163_13305 [Caldanaerobacter subterraneus subsp. yonseiensis KB-1]|uniref:Restriction endonuclease n=1 Tax=Caldanaerobacter subterraneus subsp. yonseiensis KB-1 TaxID=1388761 RepID=U5CS17_CALSX|nr:hypothetical protein [Caldanaerobacter subterraneus]ERM90907.1 hypothetical protein O163_13305 [Caldanaerobacter subterraneus subsp. yonseiensis KB-1]